MNQPKSIVSSSSSLSAASVSYSLGPTKSLHLLSNAPAVAGMRRPTDTSFSPSLRTTAMRVGIGRDQGRQEVLVLQGDPGHLSRPEVFLLGRVLGELAINERGRADKADEAFLPLMDPEVRAER